MLRRITRLGVRGRLVLLVLALGLPFLAYVAYSALEPVAREREVAKERSLAFARITAARLDDYVGDLNQLLATLSYTVSTAPAVTSELSALPATLGKGIGTNSMSWNCAGRSMVRPPRPPASHQGR
jgi:hypothetical protein